MILCAIIASKLIWSGGKRQHVSCVRSLRIWIILLFSLKMQSHPNLTSETEEKLMLYLSVKIWTMTRLDHWAYNYFQLAKLVYVLKVILFRYWTLSFQKLYICFTFWLKDLIYEMPILFFDSPFSSYSIRIWKKWSLRKIREREN